MTKKPFYSPEFRSEAVKLVLEQGLTYVAAAKRLAIPSGTLSTWVVAAKRGTVLTPGSRSIIELESEIKSLRKELSQTKQERDILKKATAYFAKDSLQSTRS
jgi:transposase